MRKYFIVAVMAASVFLFSNCHSSKKTTAEVPKVTYAGNLQTVILDKCTPCHIPANGGRMKAYDNYANVKADIADIVRRIQLNPGEKGYMPFKHPKLSDSTIALFKQWQADGTIE